MNKNLELLLRSFLNVENPREPGGAWVPNTDIAETGESLIIRMEMAGVRPDDLEVSVADDLLIVRGYREELCGQGRMCFHRLEMQSGPFLQQVRIPLSFSGSLAQAALRQGLLEIRIPRAEPAPMARITLAVRREER